MFHIGNVAWNIKQEPLTKQWKYQIIFHRILANWLQIDKCFQIFNCFQHTHTYIYKHIHNANWRELRHCWCMSQTPLSIHWLYMTPKLVYTSECDNLDGKLIPQCDTFTSNLLKPSVVLNAIRLGKLAFNPNPRGRKTQKRKRKWCILENILMYLKA